MTNLLGLVALGLAVAVQISLASSNVVFCYWGTWSVYRPENATFTVDDIDTSACTHVAYSFFGVDSSASMTILDSYLDIDLDNLAKFAALKQNNSEVKLLAAIGGWNQGSVNFSNIASDTGLRATFVENIVEFLGNHSFDGLDMDWEYPAQRGGAETDYVNFILLLQELKVAFEPYGYLLTAAVAATQAYIDISYNVPAMNEVLDYINVMTYDFYVASSPVTGVNAPLYAQLTDEANSTYNVNDSINAWISSGASPSKLVLGLGLYGHTFTLADANQAGTGANVTGGGVAGVYTGEPGIWSYLEICEAQKNEPDSWNITNVDNSYVYASSGDFWVGYDDVNTMYTKGAYARSLGLAGVMFWAIDLEDFHGSCGVKNSLIFAARDGYTSSAVQIQNTVYAIFFQILFVYFLANS